VSKQTPEELKMMTVDLMVGVHFSLTELVRAFHTDIQNKSLQTWFRLPANRAGLYSTDFQAVFSEICSAQTSRFVL
jgi:hypothetical protein